MRKFALVLLAVALAVPAYAELQNVTLDGSLRIRANWYSVEDVGVSSHPLDHSFVESRARVGVKADFTDEVSLYTEFDSYDVWGDALRSSYVTSLDGNSDGVGADDIALYQAYIEMNEAWGHPLRIRIGRQEIALGSQWLVGVNDTSSFFGGLSFDALRLTYATDTYSVDVIAAELAETFTIRDDDVMFYALYGSYLGIENATIDAYWMFVRDGTTGDETDLHTFGLRGAGTYNAFDYEAEVAYQTGDAEVLGGDVDYGEWGLNLEGGYTFDANYTPRVYLGFAYLGGDEDDADFNRLFSNWEYSEFLENSELSNFWVIRGGVSANPTEKTEVSLALSYFQAVEDNDAIVADADSDLGFEVGLYGTYNYSEDLAFNAGYAHFFTGDGADDGLRVIANGLGALAIGEDDDLDYVFIESTLKF